MCDAVDPTDWRHVTRVPADSDVISGMFTAGRILGRKAGSRASERGSLSGHQWRSRTIDSYQRRKFRSYVPFVWQSALASAAGLVVMAAGIGLCIAGFYVGHRQPSHGEIRDSNDTEVFNNTFSTSCRQHTGVLTGDGGGVGRVRATLTTPLARLIFIHCRDIAPCLQFCPISLKIQLKAKPLPHFTPHLWPSRRRSNAISDTR